MAELNFTENPLVAALVPDAGDPPVLVYLEGYLGRSSRSHYLRLYRMTPTLSGWLDIPVSRVRHRAVPRSRSPGDRSGRPRVAAGHQAGG